MKQTMELQQLKWRCGACKSPLDTHNHDMPCEACRDNWKYACGEGCL